MPNNNITHGEEGNTLSIDELKYDTAGLIPAVIQDSSDGAVLMLGYMNRESLRRTIKSGRVCFWSRSRSQFWLKGESSGNYFTLRSICTDCDADALLVRVTVEGSGVACHTGRRSCFFNLLPQAEKGFAEGGGCIDD
ncbi:MAG: phosphoribosyl-AMP cyclohydrolase [Firmicutes bacterium]|nr:phosphoribosyl-AMP cyclohydrolase [Bacillota bacterium]